MNDIEAKLERVRNLREKFHHTLAEIKPRLTVGRLVDETVSEMMEKQRGSALISAAALGAAAWLFNNFLARQKSRPISNFIKPALKQETKNHENPSTTRRYSQNQNASGHKNRGTQE